MQTQYEASRGGDGAWYAGTVLELQPPAHATIIYDDGFEERAPLAQAQLVLFHITKLTCCAALTGLHLLDAPLARSSTSHTTPSWHHRCRPAPFPRPPRPLAVTRRTPVLAASPDSHHARRRRRPAAGRPAAGTPSASCWCRAARPYRVRRSRTRLERDVAPRSPKKGRLSRSTYGKRLRHTDVLIKPGEPIRM